MASYSLKPSIVSSAPDGPNPLRLIHVNAENRSRVRRGGEEIADEAAFRAELDVAGVAAAIDDHRADRSPSRIAFAEFFEAKVMHQFFTGLPGVGRRGSRLDDIGGEKCIFHVSPAVPGGALMGAILGQLHGAQHPLIVAQPFRRGAEALLLRGVWPSPAVPFVERFFGSGRLAAILVRDGQRS